jgi:hypothetical protein
MPLVVALAGCRSGWVIGLMDEEHRHSRQCFAIKQIISHIVTDKSNN